MTQTLKPGDRARTIAQKNAAAMFRELRAICDDFDKDPAPFDETWLDKLYKDVRGCADQLDVVLTALRAATK